MGKHKYSSAKRWRKRHPMKTKKVVFKCPKEYCAVDCDDLGCMAYIRENGCRVDYPQGKKVVFTITITKHRK